MSYLNQGFYENNYLILSVCIFLFYFSSSYIKVILGILLLLDGNKNNNT